MFRKYSFFFFLFFSFTSFTQNVFDLGVRQIEIFFSETYWNDTLHAYYSNNLDQRLIADSIIIDGEVDQNVGIKYYGNSSYNINNVKNPIDIQLDYVQNGQSIDRYNRLKLSNGFRDPSFVREILSYEIASDYMPAPKATYANVYINGNLLGLYSCIQSVDDDFTNENFHERRGPLFQLKNTGISVPGCSGQLGIFKHYSDTNCYQKSYCMLSSNDWQKLGNFLDTFNNHFSEVEVVMDIDRALWFMAFENLIVALDGPINSIAENLYLFKDNNGRFSPVLWDMNMSFGSFAAGLSNPVTNNDLQELAVFHESANINNKLTNKIFLNERYKKMYIAHMRTILNEKFVNSFYLNRASFLQSLILNDFNNDPNSFYNQTQFTDNLNSSVGLNPVIGLSELMSNRVSYLQSLPEFSANAPIISNINPNPTVVLPHTSVYITAQITDANYAYLGYRFKFSDKFTKIQMYDDGNNGDGVAGDGIYGALLDVDARDIQYYIYAENNDAAIFSPERAEKEFHQIPVVSGLVINEIMAGNSTSVPDQDGEYDDWVELYNGNNFSLNLNGYYLSDNENDLFKWSFPNISIAPNDYLIIWCDTAGSSQAGLHTTYRLSAEQEEVYLSDPNGNVIDAVHFVNMITDQGYARVPNGTGIMKYQNHSFDAPNSTPTFSNEDYNKINFRAYPNPSNNIVYLLGVSGNISVFNVMGEKIFEDVGVKTIDISKWKSGIYLIHANEQIVKIVKQ